LCSELKEVPGDASVVANLHLISRGKMPSKRHAKNRDLLQPDFRRCHTQEKSIMWLFSRSQLWNGVYNKILKPARAHHRDTMLHTPALRPTKSIKVLWVDNGKIVILVHAIGRSDCVLLEVGSRITKSPFR